MKEHGGVYSAIVIDNVDPEHSGSLKVRLPPTPVSGAIGQEVWARMATLMAGVDRRRGLFPDVKDEVVVAFEEGDVHRPYVLGVLWNGANRPPGTTDANNNTKLLRSRDRVTITLDDQDGRESVVIETRAGHKLTLEDGPGAIKLTDSNGNSMKLAPNGITIDAAAKVTLNAGAIEVNTGIASVNAAISKFSGVVQCDVLISNSVVSQS